MSLTLPLADQLGHQLGAVDHLVVSAEVRVLVLEGVEGVRAVGDDLLDAVAVQGLDVLRGQHLEQVLVAEPPGRVAGRHLLGPEDGDLHAGGLEDRRQRLRDLLAVVVVAARRADEEQVLEVAARLGGERHAQALRPVAPLLGRQLPGVAVDLLAAEGRLRLLGEVGLLEHQVAAQVDELVDVGDVQRARPLAPAAGRARPDDLGVDDGRHQLDARTCRPLSPGSGEELPSARGRAGRAPP